MGSRSDFPLSSILWLLCTTRFKMASAGAHRSPALRQRCCWPGPQWRAPCRPGAGRNRRASSSPSLSVWATSQSTPAARASDVYFAAALLDIFSVQPTSLKLSSACRWRRNVSRIWRIVILFVGMGLNRLKGPAYAGSKNHLRVPQSSTITLKQRPQSV